MRIGIFGIDPHATGAALLSVDPIPKRRPASRNPEVGNTKMLAILNGLGGEGYDLAGHHVGDVFPQPFRVADEGRIGIRELIPQFPFMRPLVLVAPEPGAAEADSRVHPVLEPDGGATHCGPSPDQPAARDAAPQAYFKRPAPTVARPHLGGRNLAENDAFRLRENSFRSKNANSLGGRDLRRQRLG